MEYFYKFLTIFHKQASCPKKYVLDIKKIPNLTPFLEIFSYFWDNDSVEHV